VGLFYTLIAVALMFVVAAGVYGAVAAHKATTGRERAVVAGRVVGLIAIAGLIAFVTSYVATFLLQFG